MHFDFIFCDNEISFEIPSVVADEEELDPVSFTQSMDPMATTKPPSGREQELRLDFDKTAASGATAFGSGRRVSDATLFGVTKRSPSDHYGSGRRDSSGRIAAAAAADLNGGSSTKELNTSGYFKSAGNSARSNKSTGRGSNTALISPAERREQQLTQAEIDAVRALK